VPPRGGGGVVPSDCYFVTVGAHKNQCTANSCFASCGSSCGMHLRFGLPIVARSHSSSGHRIVEEAGDVGRLPDPAGGERERDLLQGKQGNSWVPRKQGVETEGRRRQCSPGCVRCTSLLSTDVLYALCIDLETSADPPGLLMSLCQGGAANGAGCPPCSNTSFFPTQLTRKYTLYYP